MIQNPNAVSNINYCLSVIFEKYSEKGETGKEICKKTDETIKEFNKEGRELVEGRELYQINSAFNLAFAKWIKGFNEATRTNDENLEKLSDKRAEACIAIARATYY